MVLRASVFVAVFAGVSACATAPAAGQLDPVQCAAVGQLGLTVAASKGEQLPADHTIPRLFEYYSERSEAELGLNSEQVAERVTDRAIALNGDVDVFTESDAFRDLAEPCVRHMIARGEL